MSAPSIRRRTLLAAGATTLGLAACTPAAGGPQAPVGSPAASSGPPSAPVTPVGVTPPTRPTPGPGRTTLSSADWDALARQLDGTLLRPGDHGFAGAAKTFDPRHDDQRPQAVIRVATNDDVALALTFAAEHRLHPRPRSGGHSYVGASTGDGVLVIDCGRLDRIAISGDQVSVGAGVRLGELHDRLDDHDLTVPTGTCPTVGAAGLTLGGGIGTETRLHGLTADAMIDCTVVTPDGKLRTASDERDLDWALRGGGGGNFGIVTKIIFSTAQARPGEIFRLSWPSAAAARVVRGWQDYLAEMPNRTWANLHLDSSGGSVTPSITGVSWGNQAGNEIKDLVAAVGRDPSDRQTWEESHRGAMNWFAGSNGDRRQSWLGGSDVVDGTLSGRTVNKIIDAIGDWSGSGSVAAIFDPFGGAAGRPSPTATAFPWRRASYDIQWYVGLRGAGRKNLRTAASWLAGCHDAIGRSSIGGYLNYLEPRRPLADYYGDNYDRLLKINKHYDPDGVLDSSSSLPS